MNNKFVIFLSCVLFSSILHAQAPGDTIYKNGVPIGFVKKTSSYNVITEEAATFCIYDINGIERMKHNGARIVFTGDKNSFIAHACSPRQNAIIKFIANDSILTANGFNSNYKCAFIKKYEGSCYQSTGLEEGYHKRNRKAPIELYYGNIKQDGFNIGKYKLVKKSGNQEFYAVYNSLNENIASFNISEPDQYKLVFINIETNKGVRHKLDEIKHYTNDIKAINWIYENGYFDTKLDIDPNNQTSNSTNNSESIETQKPRSSVSKFFSSTDAKLFTEKNKAVEKQDFELAASIKEEIKFRENEKVEIKTLEEKMNQSAKVEDYKAAETYKKDFEARKKNIDEKTKLREDIALAAGSGDYAKASSLKEKLESYYFTEQKEESKTHQIQNSTPANLSELEVISQFNLNKGKIFKKYILTNNIESAILEFSRTEDTIYFRITAFDGNKQQNMGIDCKYMNALFTKGLRIKQIFCEPEEFKQFNGEYIKKFVKNQKSSSEWNSIYDWFSKSNPTDFELAVQIKAITKEKRFMFTLKDDLIKKGVLEIGRL